MDVLKTKSSHIVSAIVRASNRIIVKHSTKKTGTYKRKFNFELLPSLLDYYSKELKRFYQRNNQATALCPFHKDRNPSFSVNLKTGAFLCFACGACGRSVISFHMKKHNLSFKQAVKVLGEWCNE